MRRRPSPAVTEARAWLERQGQAPVGPCTARELAALLRAADEQHQGVARVHDQAAEQARLRAQQARDLIAQLHNSGESL